MTTPMELLKIALQDQGRVGKYLMVNFYLQKIERNGTIYLSLNLLFD